jgi:hypothetical protein
MGASKRKGKTEWKLHAKRGSLIVAVTRWAKKRGLKEGARVTMRETGAGD